MRIRRRPGARLGLLLACAAVACGRVGYDVAQVGGVVDAAAPMDGAAGGEDAPMVGGAGGNDGVGGAGGEMAGAQPAGGGGMAGASPMDASIDAMAGAVAGAAAGGASGAGAGGATAGAPGNASTFCTRIPALAADPVLDGTIDPGLVALPVTPVRWDGPTPLPAGQSATLAFGWRPSGLYMFASLRDPSRLPDADVNRIYCGDAAELYVDDDGTFAMPATYDQPGTRQFVIAAPVDATTPRQDARIFRQTRAVGAWTTGAFRSFPIEGGYVVEAFVRAADLGRATWTLAAGGRVAIDFAHDLSLEQAGPTAPACEATRLGQYFLSVVTPGVGDDTDFPFRNADAFCRPTLAAP